MKYRKKPVVIEAGREMGVTCGAIYNCCIGRNKTSAGYGWGFQ